LKERALVAAAEHGHWDRWGCARFVLWRGGGCDGPPVAGRAHDPRRWGRGDGNFTAEASRHAALSELVVREL
jgi:hypothetical protein